MKKEDLWNAVGEADDIYLKESEELMGVTYNPPGVGKTLIYAASIVAVFGAMLILPKVLFGGSWGTPADTSKVNGSDTTEVSDSDTDVTADTDADTSAPDDYKKEYISYHEGVQLSFPIDVDDDRYLLFQTDPSYESVLYQIFYLASDGNWDGEILRIYRYSEGEYERNVLANFITPTYPLGTDGEYYYVMTVPTDVSIDPNDEAGIKTASVWREHVKTYFALENGLTPLDKGEFHSREYTYDGEHKFIRYYPYGTDTDYFYTLVLSQPAEQGNDGIWCVERWYDMQKAISTPHAGDTSEPVTKITGNIHIEFPDSGMLSAKEYYAELHAKVWKGQTAVPMKYLDPLTVSIAFAREVLGNEFADASYFVEVDGVPEGEYTY
ncbi:MAG: hypothetical protein IJ428_01780 [Clostridia bacterium]|nr:hypothetical protein [Clostridia bacterium]